VKARLDPFYLIVDDASWLPRLLPLGVKLVQLRIKDKSEADVRNQVVRARSLCQTHGAQLVVNDYWRIAIEEQCDFIHLGQSDLDDADMPAIRAGGLRIGVSTHDDRELKRALALSPDYVALGPIYPTLLKHMAFAPQGLEKITLWKERVGAVPLVAIGGLTPDRARAALQAGADSACVVTDILRAPDPEARTLQWIAATGDWRKKEN
jgi:thiamine-phosphate diphosphorylase